MKPVVNEGFEMAQSLNEHFSPVFTRENTNSVPLTENRFKGIDSEYLDEFNVTPSYGN